MEPTHLQGLKILGMLLGHPDYVRAHMNRTARDHQTLLDRIPLLQDVQAPWLLLFADVAETAVVDHGSHNIDTPIKGHFQKAGQSRWAKLRLRREAGIDLKNRERGDGGAGC